MMQKTLIPSLGWEDPLEEGMATHSSRIAWRIPWTEEPGATVCRVAKSWMWPKRLSTHERTYIILTLVSFLSLSCNLLPKVKMSVEITQWLTFSFCLDAQHSKRAARGSVCVCPSTNVQICACLPSPARAVLPTSNTSLFLPWSYCWAIQLRV